MKKAVFMRGMPGSGKSTYVRNNCAGARVCSADSYHMKKVRLPDGSVDEVYQWEPSRASLAHSNCLSDFISAISQNEPLVVVDNTNLRLWEIQNYLKLARRFGYCIEVVEMFSEDEEDAALCARRNVHAVPEVHALGMFASFEPIPPGDFSGVVIRIKPVFGNNPKV